jgi:hypothetical protein
MGNPHPVKQWKKGQPSPNPRGRPVGSRTKATANMVAILNARGDLDPLDYLSKVMSTETLPPEIRNQAAGLLLPYRHSKMGNVPQPAEPVFIAIEIHLPYPEANSIDQVNANITHLHNEKLAGKLDVATADNLINDQRIIGNNLLDQAKLLVAQGGPPDASIRIEGGLPELPGTNIIMPPMHNGVPVDVIDVQANPAITSSPDRNSSHE